MGSYIQFMARQDRGEIRRSYFVCGPVHRLVEEVVDRVRTTIAPEGIDDVRLVAGEQTDAEIWSELDQYPSGGRRLVSVRDAERIRSWGPFEEWLDSRLMPEAHVLFISSDRTVDTSTSYMHRIVRTGTFVRCAPFKKMEDTISVLMSHGRIDPTRARFLYDRVGGDLDAALECMAKASYFPIDLSERVITALTEPNVTEDFVTSLISGRVRAAMHAAQSVPDEDLPRLIGLLDSKLDALLKIHRAQRSAGSLIEIAKLAHLDPFVVRELLPSAGAYEPIRVRRSAEVLAFIDGQRAEGAREGLLEALAVMW